MGFRQRERKRERKRQERKREAASGSAQRQSRRSGSSAEKWWLTPLRSKQCCARCALVIREGGDAVYRHTPREVLCVPCAEQREDSKGYRPSMRWEAARAGAPRRQPPGLTAPGDRLTP